MKEQKEIKEEDFKRYRLPYKRVSMLKPACPICNEVLSGDNSMIRPLTCHKCKCIWVNTMMSPFEYEAKPIEK